MYLEGRKREFRSKKIVFFCQAEALEASLPREQLFTSNCNLSSNLKMTIGFVFCQAEALEAQLAIILHPSFSNFQILFRL
jgi:hypothetical protein